MKKNRTYYKKKPVSKIDKSLTTNQKKEVVKLVKKHETKEEETKCYAASIAPATYFVTDGPFAASPGVYSQSLCAGIAQGLTDSTRVGDKIQIKRIDIRMVLNNGINAASSAQTNWRILVFQYFGDDNTPVMNQLFLSSNANAGNTYGTMSCRNIDYMNLYHVLYDRVIHTEVGVANAANYAQSGQLAKFLHIKVPLKYAKKTIQYQAASPSNVNNGIWLAVMTDQANVGVTNENPNMYYDYDIRYTDS